MADLDREMRSGELEKDGFRRADEKRRRLAAWALAILSLAAAIVCLAAIAYPGCLSLPMLRTAFAATAAGSAVMTARALDGPVSFAAARRGAAAHSDAAAFSLTWLAWFAAIMTAVLLAGFDPAVLRGSATSGAGGGCKVSCTAGASGLKASISCPGNHTSIGSVTC